MPFLHKKSKTDHYNSNKSVEYKPKNGYYSILTNNIYLYEGYIVKDVREGFGIAATKNINNDFMPRYKGYWERNMRNKFGQRYFLNGGYYVGYWMNNMRHGFGKIWYCNGTFYGGYWECNNRSGLGLFVDSNIETPKFFK